MFASETIAAIATPVGSSGIGIIRISGEQALEVSKNVFIPFRGEILSFPTHTAHHGKIIDPDSSEVIDDAIAVIFRAPRSYTGEDVVELNCHGGFAVLKAVISAVLRAGARLAEPGEFTKRAFLNSKIDLAQAEAINDLIKSQADGSRRAALMQLNGNLSERVHKIRGELIEVLARIEASNDFPDDVEEPDKKWLDERISISLKNIDSLIETYSSGRILREGLRVVIAGRVNVGKSSLLNALLRHARAIVTPIPGTTRDIIEESLQIEGIPVVAVDTAGLRTTDDPVEKIGIELSEKMIETADVIVFVCDITEGIKQSDIEIITQIKERPVIVVLNKVDLLPEEVRSLATEEFSHKLGRSYVILQTCASSGIGIEDLEREIASKAIEYGFGQEAALVTNARHYEALGNASQSLEYALRTLGAETAIDLVSVDLTASLNYLGLITGESATEDLLDTIFSQFCIGK